LRRENLQLKEAKQLTIWQNIREGKDIENLGDLKGRFLRLQLILNSTQDWRKTTRNEQTGPLLSPPWTHTGLKMGVPFSMIRHANAWLRYLEHSGEDCLPNEFSLCEGCLFPSNNIYKQA
jgi:hypothetical protein